MTRLGRATVSKSSQHQSSNCNTNDRMMWRRREVEGGERWREAERKMSIVEEGSRGVGLRGGSATDQRCAEKQADDKANDVADSLRRVGWEHLSQAIATED